MGGGTLTMMRIVSSVLFLVLAWLVVRGRRGRSAGARTGVFASSGGYTRGSSLVAYPGAALGCLGVVAFLIMPPIACLDGTPLNVYVGYALFAAGALQSLYAMVAVTPRMLVPVAPAWARPVLQGAGPPSLAPDPVWDRVREDVLASLRAVPSASAVEVRSPLGCIIVAHLRSGRWGLDVGEAGQWVPTSWWEAFDLTPVPGSDHVCCELPAAADAASRVVALARTLGFAVGDVHPVAVPLNELPDAAAALARARTGGT